MNAALSHMLGRDDPLRHTLTDLGNAERLVDKYGHELRYCSALGGWLVWDGARWASDQTGEADRRAAIVARSIYAEAAEAESNDYRSELVKHGKRSESAKAMRDMLAVAKSDIEIATTADMYDTDRWTLNTASGTLDLRGGSLREHRPSDLLTKVTPAPYMPGASAPKWLAFLGEIFAGDGELISYVQRAAGYSLTGDITEQVIFLLHGDGANGKSTFLEALRYAFGEYATNMPMSALMASKHRGGGDRPSPDVVRLRGSRFVTAIEAEQGAQLSEVLVKQLTGGDRISARELYKSYVEFDPTFKIWLAMNHLPQIAGTDYGIWRRIHLIPFGVKIPERKRDNGLLDAMKREAAGILAWAVEGCYQWHEKGLDPPATVTGATAKYREDQDTLGRFLAEECLVGADLEQPSGQLWDAYKRWCDDEGRERLSQPDWIAGLERRGFSKKHFKTGTRWLGMRWKGA